MKRPAKVFIAFSILAALTLHASSAGAAATCFRISQLYLRDPHVFVSVIACFDITDNSIFGQPSFNQLLNAGITSDDDADGYLDLNALLIFDPLQQSLPGGPMVFHTGLCTAPMAGTTCSMDPTRAIVRINYTNGSSGTCLAPRPGTVRPYTPAVVSPASPCFASAATSIPLELGGIQFVLENGQAGATYVGNPATGLASGLLMGFLSEAAADTIIIPATYPLIGGHPVSSILRGGAGSCAGGDDRDFGVDGVTRGWWFYLNFTADQVALDAATSVASGDGAGAGVPSLRFYPPMPNPFGPTTTFAYALAEAGPVHLGVYDAAGRLVRTFADGVEAAGHHAVEWNGRDGAGRELAPGVYFARIEAAGETETQKLLVQR